MTTAGWALFAFAGAYHWTVVPIFAASAALAVAWPLRLRRSHGLVDIALAACLALVALQLVPLRPALRMALSPASAATEGALFLGAAPGSGLDQPRPLTLDPASTAWALALGCSVVLIFWSARAIFERQGGLRAVSRGIVWCGLVVSAIAFVQHALTPRLIYGFWKPITETQVPLPYGPYVNRNDLATWLILAIPLAAGYLMARLGARSPEQAHDIEQVVDARMVWLAGSLLLMLAILLASTSRSGIVGLVFALFVLALLTRRRISPRRFGLVVLFVILLGLAAMTYADVGVLSAKFGQVLDSDLGRGRVTIWRNTLPMARDFWRTGLGVGAFERGMLVYQEQPRLVFFNHAHNEYLQILVEGGVALAGAAGLALLAGWREIRTRLREDLTSVFWIRAGAAGGIAGVAIQSLWDTGLRMPANAVLLAIVAAIALHESHRSKPRIPGGPPALDSRAPGADSQGQGAVRRHAGTEGPA